MEPTQYAAIALLVIVLGGGAIVSPKMRAVLIETFLHWGSTSIITRSRDGGVTVRRIPSKSKHPSSVR